MTLRTSAIFISTVNSLLFSLLGDHEDPMILHNPAIFIRLVFSLLGDPKIPMTLHAAAISIRMLTSLFVSLVFSLHGDPEDPKFPAYHGDRYSDANLVIHIS